MSRFKDHSNMSNITAVNRFPIFYKRRLRGRGEISLNSVTKGSFQAYIYEKLLIKEFLRSLFSASFKCL